MIIFAVQFISLPADKTMKSAIIFFCLGVWMAESAKPKVNISNLNKSM